MLMRHHVLSGLVLVAAAAIGSAAQAEAHPFGPPSTARLVADGSTVTVWWHAAEDDWVALGQSLGAFEDPAGTVSTSLTGEEKLQRSPAVREYLLGKIGVSQNGRKCAGNLEPLQGLLKQGAKISFDCPAPVLEVDVTLSALTDLNESYRTVLSADTPTTPGQALFTASQTTQHLRFSSSAQTRPAAVIPLAIATGAAALIVIGGLVVRHRRRRVARI